MRKLFLLCIIACVALSSCGKLKPPKKDQLPEGHPQTGAGHGSGPSMGQAKVISGVIRETMNGGEYTYVLLGTGTGDVWAAGPQTTVKIGDSAEVSGDMPMVDFKSEALKRSFEIIFFSPAIAKPGELTAAKTSPHGMPGMTGAGANPHTSPMKQIALEKPDLAGISKAPGGFTIAEIYADRAKLAGKKVKVCGRVVKVNLGIMGKNWVHLQDGTGKENERDLTVTTDGTPSVKDKVIAEGVLVTDKDFGAGYKYSVILENATITIQE